MKLPLNIKLILFRAADVVFIGVFSLLFYYTYNILEMRRIEIYILFAVLLFLTILMRNIIAEKINSGIIKKREMFFLSLKKISENAVAPTSVSERLEQIYDEMIDVCDLSYLKIVFVVSPKAERIDGLAGIDYIKSESDAIRNYRENYQNYFSGLFESHNLILSMPKLLYRSIKFSLLKFMKRIDISGVREAFIKSGVWSEKIDLLLPLAKGERLIGFICIAKRGRMPILSIKEMSYLNTASLLIHRMIENEILFRNYLLKNKYENDLDTASYIQVRLFPKNLPIDKGFSISYHTRPFMKLTGDYFDFIEIDENRTAVIVGDVTGHGFSAAMVLSVVGIIMIAMFRDGRNITQVISEVNNFLTERYSGNEFITLFIGVYDKRTREMEYVNAGHCKPILLRSGKGNEFSYLENFNHIAGVSSNTYYLSTITKLVPGDRIIIYTDGLSELYDSENDDLVSTHIVEDVVSKNLYKSIDVIIEEFTDYIEKLGPDKIQDDITIVGMQIE